MLPGLKHQNMSTNAPALQPLLRRERLPTAPVLLCAPLAGAAGGGGGSWSVVLSLHMEITLKAVLLAAALSGLMALLSVRVAGQSANVPKCAAWERLFLS